MIKPRMYRKERIEPMLFEYETTYKTNYKFPKLEAHQTKTVPEPVVKKTETNEYLPKDYFTLSSFKAAVPFDLFITPKEILRTNPHDVGRSFMPFNPKTFSEGKDDAVRTRPRLVMTPAVSLDDIEDRTARNVIIKDMYVSTWTRESREAMMPVHNITAPLPQRATRANPITLPPLQPPVVSPEWRKETVAWDRRQLRSFVDPDRDFWTRLDIYKSCASCQQSAQVAQLKKMSRR